MARFTVTLVYSVEAESKYLARVRLGEALREGVADGVTLEFESIFFDPSGWEGDPVSFGWKAWFEETLDQLLGRPKRRRTQQLSGKKPWS